MGSLPALGSLAPGFALTTQDLKTVTLSNFKGKIVVLNIFMSLDTSTCATSVRTFNKAAADLENTIVVVYPRTSLTHKEGFVQLRVLKI